MACHAATTDPPASPGFQSDRCQVPAFCPQSRLCHGRPGMMLGEGLSRDLTGAAGDSKRPAPNTHHGASPACTGATAGHVTFPWQPPRPREALNGTLRIGLLLRHGAGPAWGRCCRCEGRAHRTAPAQRGRACALSGRRPRQAAPAPSPVSGRPPAPRRPRPRPRARFLSRSRSRPRSRSRSRPRRRALHGAPLP